MAMPNTISELGRHSTQPPLTRIGPVQAERGNRILIVGNGFVAKSFAEFLQFLGYEVTICSRHIPEGGDSGTLRYVQADLDQPGALERGLGNTRSFDLIFHLAGQASPKGSEADPSRAICANTVSAVRLLEWAGETGNGSGGLVYASSALAGGSGVYAATKRAAEQQMALYQKQYGLPTLSLRLPNLYGPGQQPDRLVPTVIRTLWQGSRPVLQQITGRDGRPQFPIHRFLYLSDALDCLLQAPQAIAGGYGGQVLEVRGQQAGIDQVCSMLRMILQEHTGRRMPQPLIRYQAGSPVVQKPSDLLVLGVFPAHSLEMGLRKTVVHWLEQQDHAVRRSS